MLCPPTKETTMQLEQATYAPTAEDHAEAELTREMMIADHTWAIWPDGSMCPREEIEERLTWMSDDYELVVVTHYYEDGSPNSWTRLTTF